MISEQSRELDFSSGTDSERNSYPVGSSLNQYNQQFYTGHQYTVFHKDNIKRIIFVTSMRKGMFLTKRMRSMLKCACV